MSDPILSHEQKVEKLLQQIVLSNLLVLTCVSAPDGLSEEDRAGISSAMDLIQDIVVDTI